MWRCTGGNMANNGDVHIGEAVARGHHATSGVPQLDTEGMLVSGAFATIREGTKNAASNCIFAQSR